MWMHRTTIRNLATHLCSDHVFSPLWPRLVWVLSLVQCNGIQRPRYLEAWGLRIPGLQGPPLEPRGLRPLFSLVSTGLWILVRARNRMSLDTGCLWILEVSGYRRSLDTRGLWIPLHRCRRGNLTRGSIRCLRPTLLPKWICLRVVWRS